MYKMAICRLHNKIKMLSLELLQLLFLLPYKNQPITFQKFQTQATIKVNGQKLIACVL